MKFELNLKKKLILGFALTGALLATVATVSYRQLDSLQETIAETEGKEAYLGRAQSALWELRYGFPQFLVLTDAENRKKILDAEPRLYKIVEDNLAKLTASRGLSDAEKAGLKEVQEIFAKYKAARPRWFELIAAGKDQEAAEWRAATTTPFGAQTVRAFANQLELTTKEDAARRQRVIGETAQNERVIGILGVIALVLGAASAWIVLRSFTRPVDRLMGTIGQVRSGDLAARTRLESKDELGELGGALDELLDARVSAQQKAEDENRDLNKSIIELLTSVHQLSNRDLTTKAVVDGSVIGTVASSINQFADETGKVLGQVSHIAARVGRASDKVKAQADSVKAVAESERLGVSEMVRNIAQAAEQSTVVAQLAEDTNKAAANATQSTDAALSRVSGTVKGMETIRETIAETEKRIKRLGERSQEITGIVNLINTIAERTHVLALNASMQAAIAGDAGRGFAVVAEEVQRLAESSRNATSQIGTLIQNIQIETNETIATVNRTISEVVAGSDLAQKAGEQMRETQTITSGLAGLVQRITEGTQKQTRSSAELRSQVDEIGRNTERTSREVDAQSAETRSLADAAQALIAAVSVFKLPEQAVSENDTRPMKRAA